MVGKPTRAWPSRLYSRITNLQGYKGPFFCRVRVRNLIFVPQKLAELHGSRIVEVKNRHGTRQFVGQTVKKTPFRSMESDWNVRAELASELRRARRKRSVCMRGGCIRGDHDHYRVPWSLGRRFVNEEKEKKHFLINSWKLQDERKNERKEDGSPSCAFAFVEEKTKVRSRRIVVVGQTREENGKHHAVIGVIDLSSPCVYGRDQMQRRHTRRTQSRGQPRKCPDIRIRTLMWSRYFFSFYGEIGRRPLARVTDLNEICGLHWIQCVTIYFSVA